MSAEQSPGHASAQDAMLRSGRGPAPASPATNAVAWHESRGVRVAAMLAIVLVGGGVALRRGAMGPREHRLSGLVEAHSVTVTSRVGGRVAQVLVTEGEHVTRGQALIVLEPGVLPARRLQFEGELAEAEARLEKAQNGAHPEEIRRARAQRVEAVQSLLRLRAGATPEEIGSAEARLSAAEAASEQAAADARRTRELFAHGSVARATLDDADAASAVAGARQIEAHKELEALRRGARPEDVKRATAAVGEAGASVRWLETINQPADMAIAQALVDQARGKVREVEIELGELTIRAPCDALVQAVPLRPGDVLEPDAGALSLFEQDQLFIRAYVPETLLGILREGQPLTVNVDSFEGERFPVAVEAISRTAEYLPHGLHSYEDRADQLFAVRLGIRGGRERLRAGMAAFVIVPAQP